MILARHENAGRKHYGFSGGSFCLGTSAIILAVAAMGKSPIEWASAGLTIGIGSYLFS
jgi:hypothetical protein